MTELIAEVASNHGGSLPLAKEFIWRFAEAGADWVKFQTTRVKHLRPDDPQYEWFRKAELSEEAHAELKEECSKAGTKFLTTVFNEAEVPFLAGLGLDTIKIGSGEACEIRLIDVCGDSFRRVIQSVHGQKFYGRGHDLLACVTRYPASRLACLKAIDCIDGEDFIGYSDHSIGIEMPMWALECGARILEKHVQLPNQARQLQPWEATVAEFKALRKYADDGPERFKGRWQAA